MQIRPSRRIQSIGAYAFAEVDAAVERLRGAGIEPIDFGVGDPTVPTPEIVREATKAAVDARASAGYPAYIGAAEYRKAAADWMKRRFGVDVDPDAEVCATIGSKEAVFHFHEGFVNPGDLVIVPTPGYPPYTRGTLFAEGEVYYVPLLPENKFLPDLESIPADVLAKARLMWINYPNSPTGVVAPPEFLKKVVEFGQENDILVASDEAYTELYYTQEPPHSILEYGRDGVVAFFSLSKRSAMTCYRIGWVAGDSRIIDVFKKVKTNVDSGAPTFIQDGAVAALSDESHVEAMRADYRKKRNILVQAMTDIGLPDCTPEATIYMWQKGPEGMSSVDFAKKLLEPEVGIVTTPGTWISEPVDGRNPGEGYVRFALVPSIEDTERAADKIRNLRM